MMAWFASNWTLVWPLVRAAIPLPICVWIGWRTMCSPVRPCWTMVAALAFWLLPPANWVQVITVGVDIDEQAVIATRYNAQVNQVEVEGLLPDAMPAGQTDLVVASILANPLRMLAPMLANRVKPGGHLILSGIYDWQAEEMIEVYAAYLPLSVWQMRDGWVCLAGQRPF